MLFIAIFANWIAPYNPAEQFRDALLAPPAWQEGGSMAHLLGTDDVGRDVLSRLMYGARLSLLVGCLVVVLSLIMGVILGLIAGYFGGLVDNIIMRVVDIMLALPSLLGTGACFGWHIFPDNYGALVFVLAPGAFIALAYLMVIINKLQKK